MTCDKQYCIYMQALPAAPFI